MARACRARTSWLVRAIRAARLRRSRTSCTADSKRSQPCRGLSGCGRYREVRPSPRGKLRRLSAGDSVGQRNCVARIRTEVGVGLEVGEHLRDFLGAWEPAGKEFLRDLLER